jgi:aminoglycoside phosphotransferase (APT) family kinase protein
MTPLPGLEPLRAAIVIAFPELATSSLRLLMTGWSCLAVDVDERLIFKFPRNAKAEAMLVTEARLLSCIRPHVSMPVPDMTIHPGPPLFSRHTKLAGGFLDTDVYRGLAEGTRGRLGAELARFYADLHGLDTGLMTAAGARPLETWRGAEEILTRIGPVLSGELRPFAEQTLAAYRDLPPDPLGATYGFFDGHGWNMAFDAGRSRLSGIYDFGDSGIGPLHQDFIYSNMIARDLTVRIINGYEALTGRLIDRERVDVLTGAHRLWELSEAVGKPDDVVARLRSLTWWLDDSRLHAQSR